MSETRLRSVSSPPPSMIALACRLTCAFAHGFEGAFSSGGFPRVVAGGGAAVLRSWWPSWAGFAGFGCTGWAGDGRADVPEPAADAGGGQPSGRGGPVPGEGEGVSGAPGPT